MTSKMIMRSDPCSKKFPIIFKSPCSFRLCNHHCRQHCNSQNHYEFFIISLSRVTARRRMGANERFVKHYMLCLLSDVKMAPYVVPCCNPITARCNKFIHVSSPDRCASFADTHDDRRQAWPPACASSDCRARKLSARRDLASGLRMRMPVRRRHRVGRPRTPQRRLGMPASHRTMLTSQHCPVALHAA